MNERPSIFSNERSVASAGAGKTYSLTNRFIALASLYNPESVCALTFTRMAAAEFLDKILTKLAAAAIDGDFAEVLGAQISEITGRERLSRLDFLSILKRVAAAMPRLNLSTIDAFQARFVGAFASELGIVGSIKIMDDFEKVRARKSVLNSLLSDLSTDGKKLARFASLVNTASLGRTQKNAFAKLDDYVKTAHKFFMEFPYLSRWGAADKLKTSIKPQIWNCQSYEKNLSRLCEIIELGGEPKKVSEIFTFLKNSRLGSIYKGSKLTESLFQFIREGGLVANFDFGKGKTLSLPAAQIVEKMLGDLAGASLSCACESARAVGEIACAFERLYSKEIRLRGSLAFEDVTSLLLDSSLDTERSLVEYRMDSQFNHWMIDEFQDTSRAQWRTIENLVDELFSDDSGARTFYYVGDPKQSIYAWRGGAPDLFDEIFKKYSGAIRDGARLNVSRRSVEPVIDAVNALFGSEQLTNFNFDAGNQWLENWSEHISYPELGNVGCVALVKRDKETELVGQVYNILKNIYSDSGKNTANFTCAVLVQTNAYAENILDGLRERFKKDNLGLSVAGELDCSIAEDNMVVPAVLKLLHAAAHPIDTAAAAYVRMTPLAPFTQGENWSFAILEKISENGFENFIREISTFLDSKLDSSDAFSRKRLAQLAELACEYAARGSIDDFVEFAKSYKLRESSSHSAVRVMTIHKSKGLDFDIVILPQLENGKGHDGSLRLRLVGASNGGGVVLNMPAEGICRMDRVLNTEFEKMLADNARSQICKFYVGSTRAKRAMYFISEWFDDTKKPSGKYSFARHVYDVAFVPEKVFPYADTEVCVPFGSIDWYKNAKAESAEKQEDKIEILKNPRKLNLDFETVAPSLNAERRDGKNGTGKIFGKCVHSILENLSIGAEPAEAALAKACKNISGSPDILEAAQRTVGRALSVPEIFAIFAESENVEVKRELPFTAFVSGKIVSGVLDRVHLFKNPSGAVEKVSVIDFKTSAQEASDFDFIERYAGQMSTYKKAVECIYPAAEIECLLVNVSRPKVLRV